MKMFNGWLVVRTEDRDEKTSGGIYVPGTSSTRMVRGKVLFAADSTKEKPQPEEGSTVLYDSISGTVEVEIKKGGEIEKLDLITLHQVVAVV